MSHNKPKLNITNVYKKKTFREFMELVESSTDERSGRRTRGKVTLARGRGADMTKSERTTAAISKKAGLRGTGRYSTKDLRTKPETYTTNDSKDEWGNRGSTEQDTYIHTYASPRKAAKDEALIKKTQRTGDGWKVKTTPSSDSVRRVKDLRKQIIKAGANKRGKVHSAEIIQRDVHVKKNDPQKRIERGKKFFKALDDTPKQLKKAGAKPGEAVIGSPSAAMPDENKTTGQLSRTKLYLKRFGKNISNLSHKSGIMTSKVQ